MGSSLILETTFLIDFERENNRGRPGAALEFLEAHEDSRLYITFTIAGELAAGISLSERTRWEDFIGPFHILPFTPDVAWQYGRAYRHLHENRQMIGANDLWIAATALAYGMPIVTADAPHYRRVPDLDVVSHRPDKAAPPPRRRRRRTAR